MKYDLVEVAEIPPDGRGKPASPRFYDDILKAFIEKQYPIARVETPGRSTHVVAMRLETRIDTGISVITRGDEVYLKNHALVNHLE